MNLPCFWWLIFPGGGVELYIGELQLVNGRRVFYLTGSNLFRATAGLERFQMVMSRPSIFLALNVRRVFTPSKLHVLYIYIYVYVPELPSSHMRLVCGTIEKIGLRTCQQ